MVCIVCDTAIFIRFNVFVCWYVSTLCLKKTVQYYFYQNFVKFPPTVKIFGTKMVKRINLCEVYSFSTLPPNLCQK